MNKNKSSGGIWFFAFVVIGIMALFGSCGGGSSYNTRDGKCDICGKNSVSKFDGNEYCKKHYNSALDYYLDD